MAQKKVCLTVYALSICDDKNKRVILNAIDGKENYLDIVKDMICNNISKYSQDKQKEILFKFDVVDKETVKNDDGQESFDILFGRVKTGEYGVESELVNIMNGDVYNRTPDQADVMPFGFCIALPKGDVTQAIIILQTLGVHGMKVSLQKRLVEYTKKINDSYKLFMNPIAPKEYIDRYFNGGILKKIRMIRHEIPEDVSDRIGINYGVRQTKEERIIHSPLGYIERNKKKLQEWRAGQRSYTELIEIDGFEYDDLKFEFALGGDNKTFNLKEMDNIVVVENVTKKVSVSGGHPVFDSLKEVMKATAFEYLKGMGLCK